MEYGYKTLVLVDNSASVTSGNQQIVKETLKYLIKNAPEGDDFALATYSNQTEMLVNYGATKEEYMQAIDKITYTEKTTCLSDVLMDTVSSWREADFAMRNILLFTDGQLNESDMYPIEEVYFRLNESSYPIYAVGLNQQTNEGMLKRVASLARISHGEMFYSEFEDSEADVEIKLTEQLIKAMNDKRTTMEGINNGEEDYVSTQNEAKSQAEGYENVYTEDYEPDAYAAAYSGELSTESLAMTENPYKDYMPLMIIGGVIIMAILIILLLGRNSRRREKSEDRKYEKITDKPVFVESPRMITQSKAGEMTLEDMNNPMMYFKLPPFEHIILGSNKTDADIAIAGDEGIESRHCEINYHFGKYYVRDLKSCGGTYLNGERLNNETELHSADVISLGHARLMVKLL